MPHEVSALVLLQLLFHDDVLCVEAVSLSWRLVKGLSANARDFWPALKAFISMTFHHQLLQLTDSQAPTLVTTLKQVIETDFVGYGGKDACRTYTCYCLFIFFRLPVS